MSLLSRRPFQKLRQAPKIVKVLYAQQFLEGFVPIAALYTIMFERVGGLHFEQIGLLFSLWSLAYLITELPTGVLADYWSRKGVIIIGGVVRALAFVIWMTWPTFTGYAIGFALWGAMIACSSGAVSAYLHDELRAIGKGAQFAKFFGWIMSALWLGMLVAYLTAAVLTLERASLLIAMGVASSILMSLLLLAIPEHPYKRQATYLKTLAAGFREIKHSKKLRYVCFGLFSVFMVIGVLEELLPRLFEQFGLNDSGVSLVLAASLVVTVVLLAKLESFVTFSLARQMLVMCAGLVCLLAGLAFGGLGAVGLVLIFSLVFHLFRPVFMHHVQEIAQGDERATIGSIPGLAAGLFSAAAYAGISAVAAVTSEQVSIAIYGALWLVILLALALWGRQYGSTAAEEGAVVPGGDGGQPSTQF